MTTLSVVGLGLRWRRTNFTSTTSSLIHLLPSVPQTSTVHCSPNFSTAGKPVQSNALLRRNSSFMTNILSAQTLKYRRRIKLLVS